MKLEHSFLIEESVEVAWDVLNDVRKVAQCLPGATIDEVAGDEVLGSCRIKLGPISLTYKGRAEFVERDRDARRIVVDGQAKDGSNGRAALTVTASLTDEGAATRVDLVTDLKITGKPAQFGRGVMADVGERLIGQFAVALAAQLEQERSPAVARTPQAAATSAAQPVGGPLDAVQVDEPLDLLAAAGPVLARRAATAALPLLVVIVLAYLYRKGRA